MISEYGTPAGTLGGWRCRWPGKDNGGSVGACEDPVSGDLTMPKDSGATCLPTRSVSGKSHVGPSTQAGLLPQTGSMRGRGIGETLLHILHQEGPAGLFR